MPLILELLTSLRDRTLQAFLTLPDLQATFWMLGLLIIFAAIALPVGFYQKFLEVDLVRDPTATLSTVVIALIYPSIFEEWLFRVLFMPDWELSSLQTRLGWMMLSLGIFVVAHPLNTRLFFPDRKATFDNATFLSLAGLLGGVCTAAYWQSHSIWPPVMLHWLIVSLWLTGLGGHRRVNSPNPESNNRQLTDLQNPD